MAQDKFAQICGMVVCAVVVLGIDDPRWGMSLGVALGALAIFALTLTARRAARRKS